MLSEISNLSSDLLIGAFLRNRKNYSGEDIIAPHSSVKLMSINHSCDYFRLCVPRWCEHRDSVLLSGSFLYKLNSENIHVLLHQITPSIT